MEETDWSEINVADAKMQLARSCYQEFGAGEEVQRPLQLRVSLARGRNAKGERAPDDARDSCRSMDNAGQKFERRHYWEGRETRDRLKLWNLLLVR
jgi:ribosome-binding protein aMBF1 (putative translation factor)